MIYKCIIVNAYTESCSRCRRISTGKRNIFYFKNIHLKRAHSCIGVIEVIYIFIEKLIINRIIDDDDDDDSGGDGDGGGAAVIIFRKAAY